MKQKLEIERLLQWAYRDELPKRQTSSADGNIWGMIEEYGQRGGVDIGHSAAQRYPHFGLPHPDALKIEEAVAELQDYAVDWSKSIDRIAGDLAGLVQINKAPKATTSGWTNRKTGKWQAVQNRPRNLVLVGTIRPKALITIHAKQGTRPDWREEDPRPERVIAAKSGQAKIEGGTCEGKNKYSLGTFCPVDWQPSPVAAILARADYVGWWQALAHLAATMDLVDYQPTPPTSAELPWFGQQDDVGDVIFVPPMDFDPSAVALKPQRRSALAPYKYQLPKPPKREPVES